jgi:hypothetical protein
LLAKYNEDKPEDTEFRSNLWAEQVRKDFKGFNPEFTQEGDEDGWASTFIDAVKKVDPHIDRRRPIFLK